MVNYQWKLIILNRNNGNPRIIIPAFNLVCIIREVR